MKKILLITDSSFISKNFQDYIKVNNIKKKLLDSKYIFSKGWRPKVDLKEGINKKVYH